MVTLQEIRQRAAAMTDRELVSWLSIWEQVRRIDKKFARVASPGSPAWLTPEPSAPAIGDLLRAELKKRSIAKRGGDSR